MPQARERTDRKETGQPRGPQGVGGAARPPEVGGTGGCTPGGPPPSAGMPRRGGAGSPHPLIPPSRPTSAGWASAGGQGSNDGGRKLGRCRLPQAPVCELTPGGTQPPQRRRGRRGPLTPPHSAGHGHVSSSWSTPSRRQLRDQSGGLPGGASRGKTHRHSAHKGPLADGAVGCPALEPGQAGRGPDLRPNQGASARFQLGLLGESTVLGATPQLCGDCSRRDHPLPGVHGATVTL